MLKTEFAVRTCSGPFRASNQDTYYINGEIKAISISDTNHTGTLRQRKQLFAVCDGMGGLQYGEYAAHMAVSELGNCLWNKDGNEQSIKEALQETSDLIFHYGTKKNADVGSTIALIGIINKNVLTCNVGDSRIYFFRDGELFLLSQDHTEFQELLEAGIYKKNDIYCSKSKNRLTQWLGMDPEYALLSPSINQISVKKGDLFVLCTDGVYMYADGEIESILRDNRNVNDISELLIESAIKNGSKDNVTAMVVKIK